MNFTDGTLLDESLVLKLFGGLLGIIALIYFGIDTILNLSPTLKALLLLMGSAGFFFASDLVSSKILRAFLYVFSSFTYLSFLLYSFSKFNPGSGQVFAVLVISAFAFIGLGRLRSEEQMKLGRRQSKTLLLSIVLLVFAIGIFDSVGARPEYSLELKDEVEVVEGEELVFGTLEVRNDFLFSRNLDLPNLEGCMEAGEEPIHIYDSIGRSSGDDLIGGKKGKSFNLTDQVRSRPDSNTSISGTYSIVEGECPDKLEENTIYLEVDSGDGIELARSEWD